MVASSVYCTGIVGGRYGLPRRRSLIVVFADRICTELCFYLDRIAIGLETDREIHQPIEAQSRKLITEY